MRAPFSAQDNATLFCKPPGPSAPPAVVAEFWMNATGGVQPYTYVWSFGDGTSTASSRPGMVQVYQQLGEFNILGVVYDATEHHVLANAIYVNASLATCCTKGLEKDCDLPRSNELRRKGMK